MFILLFFKQIARIFFFPLLFVIDIRKKFLYQQDRGHWVQCLSRLWCLYYDVCHVYEVIGYDFCHVCDVFTTNVASLIYVNETQNHAVWFTYLVNNWYRAGTSRPIRVKGVGPSKNYRLQEVNIYPGTENSIGINEINLSGDYLMTFGFDPMINAQRTGVIIEFQLANWVQALTCFLNNISRQFLIVFYVLISLNVFKYLFCSFRR